jgi:hypothetical protein
VEIMKKTIEGWIQLTDDALSSTEAAVDVLNDLLNYDKIESGTLRLEFSSVPIWQVLKKTTAGLVMQAREKNVTFELSGKLWDGQLSPSELVEYQTLCVVGDSMRISQVLRNLLSNAVKVCAACCMLYAVCCVLCAVCYAWYVLCAVCCMLGTVYSVLYAMYWVLYAVCYVLCAVCVLCCEASCR